MSDTPKKLREFCDHLYPVGEFYAAEMELLLTAADEIEQLEAEIVKLRKENSDE